MALEYQRAVHSSHVEESPRDLLESPVSVLVGVDDDATDALAEIDVDTVHALATSPVFEVARAAYETAANGGPSGSEERVSATTALGSGDPAEILASSVGELEGVDEAASTLLRSALGVKTVRDLAQWPPYRGARTILGAVTGEGAETEDGVPTELVPTARKYATEETFYSKVYLDRQMGTPEPESGGETPDYAETGRDYGAGSIPGGWNAGRIPDWKIEQMEAAASTIEPAQGMIDAMTGLRESLGETSSDGDDGESDLPRTLVVDSTGTVEYSLRVSGSLTSVDDETLPPDVQVTAEGDDHVRDDRADGSVSGDADGFRFSGQLLELTLDDPDAATVSLDGTLWQDGSVLDKTLVLDATNTAGTGYELEVGGSIAPVDSDTLEPGIGVDAESGDQPTGTSIDAHVGGDADGYRFSGDLVTFEMDDWQGADVYVDGKQVEYPSTLGSTDINLSGSGRVDVEQANPETGGFDQPAVGGLLEFSQQWVPQGLSLGQLLHSTTLAPGESTKVAVVDWSRRTRGQRQEAEAQQEQSSASMTQNRSISEVQDGVTNEVQRGSSTVSSRSQTKQTGGSAQAGINTGIWSAGGSVSHSSSTSTSKTSTVSSSMGRRSVHTEMSQKISNATQQHASASRTRRATVVRETEQSESEEIRTRIVTNHNHMHALSVHYYEVVQIFRVEVRPETAKPVLFVPFELLDFTNRDLVFKHRQTLKRAALDDTTRTLIDQATGYVSVLPSFELESGVGGGDHESELRSLGGELETDGTLSLPGESRLQRVILVGPVRDLIVHRREGQNAIEVPRDRATSVGDALTYDVREDVPFSEIDRIEATTTLTDGEPDLPNTLVINGREGEDGATEYRVQVSGEAKLVDGETLEPGIDVTNENNDEVTHGTVTGRVSTGADGIRFSGDLEGIEVDRDVATVYLGDEEFAGDSQLDKKLTITSAQLPFFEPINYRIQVSGGLVQDDADLGEAKTIAGSTAAGSLEPANSRTYRYSGSVENIWLSDTNMVSVTVDGQTLSSPNNYTEATSTDAGSQSYPAELDITLELARPNSDETNSLSGQRSVDQDRSRVSLLDVVGADDLQELVRRLDEERLYYSQAVWQSMDAQTLTMMLAGYDIDGRSAAEFVDPVPEAVHGNYVGFPLAIPESAEKADDRRTARLAAWWGDWKDQNFDDEHVERDLVPLPSGGVHGEAVLGRSNGAEKLDLTRFWDWQESPIPQSAPQIAPVGTGSRAGEQDLTSGDFEAPIVEMQQPQDLPDPTGVGATLDALTESDIFRDMSGLDAAASVTESGQQVTGEGARHAADTAARTYETAAKARVQQTKTLAELAATLATQGAYSASKAGNSSFGAALNQLKKNGASGQAAVEERTDSGTASNGSSPTGGSDGGGSGENSGGSSGGGASGGGGGGTGNSSGGDGAQTDGGTAAQRSLRERLGLENYGTDSAWENGEFDWGRGLAGPGATSGATCRSNIPSTTDELIIGTDTYSPSGLTVTNWGKGGETSDVYHFRYAPVESEVTCRLPGDITEIVFHGTMSPTWDYDRGKQMEQVYVKEKQVAIDSSGNGAASSRDGESGSDGGGDGGGESNGSGNGSSGETGGGSGSDDDSETVETTTKYTKDVDWPDGKYKPYEHIPTAKRIGDDFKDDGAAAVHIVVERDGTVVQHNDLVDEIWHGEGRNDQSIGIDLVTAVTSVAANDGQPSIPVEWPGSSDNYYHPTKEQTEAATQLVDWLTDSSKSHGLAIDEAWTGVDTDKGRYYVDTIHSSSHTSSGTWAHGHYEDDRWDGYFVDLYSWLRLASKGGDGMSQNKAWSAVEEILQNEEGTSSLLPEDSSKKQYFDISEYTGNSSGNGPGSSGDSGGEGSNGDSGGEGSNGDSGGEGSNGDGGSSSGNGSSEHGGNGGDSE